MKPTKEQMGTMAEKVDVLLQSAKALCPDKTELMTVLASTYTMAIVELTADHPKANEMYAMIGKGLEQGCRTLAGKGKKHDG